MQKGWLDHIPVPTKFQESRRLHSVRQYGQVAGRARDSICDFITAAYCMSSSARTSSDCGIVSPSALAVFIRITHRNRLHDDILRLRYGARDLVLVGVL